MPRLRILQSPPMGSLSTFFSLCIAHQQRLRRLLHIFFCFLPDLVVVLRIHPSTFVFNRNESACREGAYWKKKKREKENEHTSECGLKFARLFKWPTNTHRRCTFDIAIAEINQLFEVRESERARVESRFFIPFVRNLFRHFYELKNNINKRTRLRLPCRQIFRLPSDFD